jgi:p-hydroxybenzoate 3-monooxygenase
VEKSNNIRKTQVGIIGAGPAGLMLSHLLHLQGIHSIILEDRSRSYVESRVRAGLLEQNTVDVLKETGVADRLLKEGLEHHGIILSFNGERHRIALSDLTGGRAVTIYGQQEVIKDLIKARLDTGGEVLFESEAKSIEGLDSSDKPKIYYEKNGETLAIECDFVAGCDGYHGISRKAVPDGVLTYHERIYPFGWLGILAEVAPSTDELIYSYHPRGFALHSLRSNKISRLYVQCDANDKITEWPDERIWQELHIRLAAKGWSLKEGPILEKAITAMRSFMIEPMQYGKLFIAGDAAHIVPPTGGKGLNLAVADVKILSEALVEWYRTGKTELLENYSARCLKRVWRVQDFSNFMTHLLHKMPYDDPFEYHLQKARFDYIVMSEAMSKTIAENYVGLKTI